jgi:chromosome segregation ATPase
MRAFLFLLSVAATFAAGWALYSMEFQPALLLQYLRSRPLPEQIAWALVCLVPLVLFAVALMLREKLERQRKATELLEARLGRVRDAVTGLVEAHKDNESAMSYLAASEPEDAIAALEGRLSKAEQAAELHQAQNEAADLFARIEHVRQQQHAIKDKLSGVIGKRQSIEKLVVGLQDSQNDIESTLLSIELDKNGRPLGERLQRIADFGAGTGSRFEEIERCTELLLRLKSEFAVLQQRLMPLEDKETGVRSELQALSKTREQLATSIERLEREDGMPLAARVQKLTLARGELDQQVAHLLEQFSKLDAIHKDISELYGKLNRAERTPRELESNLRAFPKSG